MPSFTSYGKAHAYETGKRVRLKDKRVSLVSYAETVDDEGNEVEGYRVVADVWAYVRQVDQTTRANTSAPYSEEQYVLYLNWREDLRDGKISHVVYGGRAYEVTRADTYEGYRRDIALYVKTPGADGPALSDIAGL